MKFTEIGLHPDIMAGLEAMRFEEMTPVQEQTIPVLLEGRDLIGCAQTGTGKTAAYTLPILQRLMEEGNPDNVVRSLIVVPTRELAQQIDTQFQGFGYFLPLSTTVVYGGGDGKGWDQQKRGMLMGSDVVIATPGRLLSHIANSGIDLSHVSYFVLDEADRMLDMGFFDDIMRIVAQLPKERQTLMFSATLPPKIREMARQILRDPAEINIAVSKPNEAIEQGVYVCYETQKAGIIRTMFAVPPDSKTIIFSSSKLKVKELAHTFKRMKINAAAMHSDLEQSQRDQVMLDFKNGRIDLLVATDIVARGIDIEDIGTVINYDVPYDPEDYIHRIGRTARASATGRAFTFVSEKEQGQFHRIERFLEREIPKLPLPEEVGEGPAYEPSADRGRGGRSGRKRNGRSGQGRRDKGRDKGCETKPREARSENGTTTNEVSGKRRDNRRRKGRGREGRPAEMPALTGSETSVREPERAIPANGTADEKKKSRRRHRGGRKHRRGGGGSPAEGGTPVQEA